jgi:hypothetical protein
MLFCNTRDPIFMMYAVSNFLTSIGFNVPYVYTVVSMHIYLLKSTFFINIRMHVSVWRIRIQDPGSGAFLTPGSGIRDPE